jgi:hypothetical protein
MMNPQIRNFFLAIVILPITYSVQAQQNNRDFSCIVSEQDNEGEWIASRNITESNGSVSAGRDTYEWLPKEKISFGPGATLKWYISYYWPADAKAQKVIPENEVVVSLNFRYDAKLAGASLNKPDRTWIHFYRSNNPEDSFSFSATSLTDVMFWNQSRNGDLDTKAVVPLDHLLAFGTSFDALVWNIRTQPDVNSGGTRAIAKGIFPIAKLRGKVSKILKLRRLLDKQAANFRKECDVPIVVTGDISHASKTYSSRLEIKHTASST